MKETDIRRRKLFDNYLSTIKKDIPIYFKERGLFQAVSCPGCNSKRHRSEFKKNSFVYALCDRCGTIFVNPRPCFKQLKAFYVDSASSRYWTRKFFPPVAEARRREIFRPRAEYIGKVLSKKNKWTVGDVGAGFGLFLEELAKLKPSIRPVVIEPSVEMADICRSKGLEVIPQALEDIRGWDRRFDLLTAFELFEHLYDPGQFLKKIGQLLRPGGYLFLTTLNGKGFDIQMFWEKSKSIFPPHHLNFFNPGSVATLLQKNDFIVEEISTPGQLDWDIVEGMILKEKIKVGRFWQLLAKSKNEQAKKALQDWIRKYQFSSHMQVLAKKK
ncbi:MAG: class I SAM-dependent methyltransferase [Candidatus Omnitrophota bacterium]|nr:MAG: class I SAM-dependent methyltransferase [Candidatus Omnitrophota bacterium]